MTASVLTAFAQYKSENTRVSERKQKKKRADLSNAINLLVVPVVGLEPTRGISPADFESATSTNSITPARGCVHPTVSLPRLSPVLNGGREPRRELTNLPESSYCKTAEKSRVEQGLETAGVPAFESVYHLCIAPHTATFPTEFTQKYIEILNFLSVDIISKLPCFLPWGELWRELHGKIHGQKTH